MVKSRFVRIVALLALLLTAFAASAQPSPRGVPINDNLEGALLLPVGGTIKIKDPGAASTEIPAGEPDACGITPHNSVWFTFTPTAYGKLFLTTTGTKLVGPANTRTETILSVYAGSAYGALTPKGCDNTFNPFQSEVTLEFFPGTTYSIQLTTYFDLAYSPQSYYKLTSRVTQLYMLPENFGFESPLSPNDWTLTHATGDDRACSSASYPAYIGICSFKFTGGANESSKLTQTVIVPGGFHLRKKGTLIFYLWYRGMESVTIGSATATATLLYGDGTPSQKITLRLKGLAASTEYAIVVGNAVLSSASLKKVKIRVNFKAAAGVLLLDEIVLNYGASAMVRENGGALPVPAVASAR